MRALICPGPAAHAACARWPTSGRGLGSTRSRRAFSFPHGAVVEDPGTGSACANLGGWLVATGAARPQSLTVAQGEAVGRPCQLGLDVDADGRIFVSGRVLELGRGTIRL